MSDSKRRRHRSPSDRKSSRRRSRTRDEAATSSRSSLPFAERYKSKQTSSSRKRKSRSRDRKAKSKRLVFALKCLHFLTTSIEVSQYRYYFSEYIDFIVFILCWTQTPKLESPSTQHEVGRQCEAEHSSKQRGGARRGRVVLHWHRAGAVGHSHLLVGLHRRAHRRQLGERA